MDSLTVSAFAKKFKEMKGESQNEDGLIRVNKWKHRIDQKR